MVLGLEPDIELFYIPPSNPEHLLEVVDLVGVPTEDFTSILNLQVHLAHSLKNGIKI